MRPWSEQHKNTLRNLAAARYFLPVELGSIGGQCADAQYQQFLHHTEWGLALDELDELGRQCPDDPLLSLFWEELALAAQNMGMHERALDFRQRATAQRGKSGAS